MSNAINWFEIPAADFDRAVEFYSALLGRPVQRGEFLGVAHGFLPDAGGEVAGAIIATPVVAGGEPRAGEAGPLIYLNAGGEIAAMAGRVAAAGGSLLVPPTAIGPQGQIAIFRDSEGNRVGLHAPPQG